MNARTPTPAQIRAAAARLVTGVLHDGRSLDDLFSADPDEGSARGLKRSLVYGTLRWHFRLDALLRRLADRSPDGMPPILRALIEVGLFQLLSGETVRSSLEPGAVRAQLPASPPDEPESFDGIFNDLDRVILPGLAHWQHPGFFGYFLANGDLASVLGDYLITGLGVLGLSWQSSPAQTELEELVTDWMRQMIGLSDSWSGVIQDTASTSTLVALLCARERATNYSLVRGGLQEQEKPLVIYVSGHSHSSVEKAALLAGFGRANLHTVPTDGNYAMQPEALAEAVQSDIEHPGEEIEVLHLNQNGVATSGKNRRRWLRNGLLQHHLIDPLTGQPAETDLLTVTVIAHDVLQAEAAAKAAFLFGSHAGLEWIETHPDLAGLLILDNGEMWLSARVQEYL